MTWMENENRVDTMLLAERAVGCSAEMRPLLDSPEGQGGDLSRGRRHEALRAGRAAASTSSTSASPAAGHPIGRDLRNGSTLDGRLLHVPGGGGRDAGLRAVDANTGRLSAEAADRLDELLRHGDPGGREADYLAAVGDAAYETAFMKVLAHPQDAHLRFSPDEAEAMQRAE